MKSGLRAPRRRAARTRGFGRHKGPFRRTRDGRPISRWSFHAASSPAPADVTVPALPASLARRRGTASPSPRPPRFPGHLASPRSPALSAMSLATQAFTSLPDGLF
ncbi:hypothetical protein FA95DRAFT_1558596 [Auriscalpium vulgare]|uniref:Uncharacterized protein n=1 Tax=Auriscalpium vulgare TaxID=40419 RepID=A0ACB8RVG0_9AGAM|nr:hypothetical protein FA95DRAFT_1558596 [Auriscalpium vulgare]